MKDAAVFLCDYQAPYGGNFIASLTALESKLAARDIAVVYLLPEAALARPWCAALTARGSTLECFDRDAGACKTARQIASVCKKYRAGVLYVHFGKYACSALAALFLPKLRLVWHYHSDFSAGRGDSARRRAKRAAANALTGLLGKRVTRIAVAAHIAQQTPACTVLPNAIARDRLAAEHAGRSQTRLAMGLSENEILVLLFGWSPHIKGVDIAANALALLNAREVPAVLGLVGGREYPENRMREWIAAHTGCTGQESFLHFLPPTEDVFAYHEAADVMLSASRSEANPYSLLEAIATERPCAVTDIPGTRYLSDLPTVFFAPPEDALLLANAIEKAAIFGKDPANAPLLSAAKARIETQYAIDPWTDRVAELLGF